MKQSSTFGERLAYARWWRFGVVFRERDEELAKRLGLSGPAFSQWRERDEPPDTAKVERLAHLCDLDFDWLLRGDRSPNPAPDYFPAFVTVYRDWVKRGGLKRKEKKPPLKTTRERSTTLKADERKRRGS